MLLTLEVSTDFTSCKSQGTPCPLSPLPRPTNPWSLAPKESSGTGTVSPSEHSRSAPPTPQQGSLGSEILNRSGSAKGEGDEESAVTAGLRMWL